MELEKSIRAIEEQLRELRGRVETARADLDKETRFAIRLVEYQAGKARDVANEALAELRHLDDQLRQLTSDC